MEVKFVEEVSKFGSNIVFITNSDFALHKSAKEISEIANVSIDDLIKVQGYKGEHKEIISIPTATEKIKNIFVASIGKMSELSTTALLQLGGKIYSALNTKKADTAKIYFPDIFKSDEEKKSAMFDVMLGALLKSYKFDKYLSKKKDKVSSIEVISETPNQTALEFEQHRAVFDGSTFTRDLVSEPPNVLNPISYAQKCNELQQLGVEVEILDETKMAELGMNALLGVAQGSANKPRMVILRWNGAENKNRSPLAFVGKGVTFDTGGLSLKPANSMVGMKYDMAGSAVVAGLIKTLALRKAKVNVVGVLGLVENMPDGKAQRPEDIVKSMSGQTIEILNTDAEGRLVLADALWYTQSVYKPEIMVDLATLTGAIVVALGDQYAGMFSNNDMLSERLYKAGIETDEKVWRFPLTKEYDKLIDSKNADMQNIGSDKGGAGSITAAQFLQRFVNNVVWAHLDIAGVTMTKSSSDIYQEGANGFGVRLLNKFVKDNYEK